MNHESIWEQLEKKSTSVLGKWYKLILGTYPAETARFLRNESDSFNNPVGHVISEEIETIYNELLHETNPEKLAASLDAIIRIRTVQDFTASQAAGFIFLLKQAVREELSGEIAGKPVSRELLDFESRIDRLALDAFDIYVKCRDKISDIRMNEVVARSEMVMRVLASINAAGEMEEKP